MANYRIESDFSNVHILAEHLQQFCKKNTIDESLSNVLELMLVEAVNNVVEHAYAGKAGFVIDAQFDVNDDEVTITLIDEGVFFPESVYGEKRNQRISKDSYDELPEGGWGIGLITTIADDIEKYNVNGTNILVLTKYLKEVALV